MTSVGIEAALFFCTRFKGNGSLDALRSFKITTILFLSLIIVAQAQAIEPTSITLSCDGTVKGQRKAINNVGVVVDFAGRDVGITESDV
jgi:hypothetical protein